MLLPDPIILRPWVLLCGALLHGLGILVGGIVALYKLAQNSKKPGAEIHKTLSEAELNEAKADSIEFRDQLSAIKIVHQFMQDGLALEQLLQKKNRIIADQDNIIFEQRGIIEKQDAELQAYERQKLGELGLRRLEQSEGKTGTGK